MCRGLHHHVLQPPPPSFRKEQAGPWSFLDHLNSNPLTTLLDFKSHGCSALPSTLTPLMKELLSCSWIVATATHLLTLCPFWQKFPNRFLCYYKYWFFPSFFPSYPLPSLSLFLSFHYNLRTTHNWYPASLIIFCNSLFTWASLKDFPTMPLMLTVPIIWKIMNELHWVGAICQKPENLAVSSTWKP